MAKNSNRMGSLLPADAKWVRAGRIAEMLDVSIRTVYRLVAKGQFPRPVRIGKATTRWRVRDIEAYLERPRTR